MSFGNWSVDVKRFTTFCGTLYVVHVLTFCDVLTVLVGNADKHVNCCLYDYAAVLLSLLSGVLPLSTAVFCSIVARGVGCVLV
jgi:hypothetical protein